MKTIGAHFLDDLRSAGVQLDGMSWGPDGLIYADDYPEAERAKAQAVFDAHDADNPPRTRSAVLAELAALDALGVTRALEDLAGVLTPEQVAGLPAITRERLEMKSALRAELSTL